MLKYLLLARTQLMSAYDRSEHGLHDFEDEHSSAEWAAFDRALHTHIRRSQTGQMFRVLGRT